MQKIQFSHIKVAYRETWKEKFGLNTQIRFDKFHNAFKYYDIYTLSEMIECDETFKRFTEFLLNKNLVQIDKVIYYLQERSWRNYTPKVPTCPKTANMSSHYYKNLYWECTGGYDLAKGRCSWDYLDLRWVSTYCPSQMAVETEKERELNIFQFVWEEFDYLFISRCR